MFSIAIVRFPIKKFGPTTWVTYAEMGERFKSFGAYLRSIGNTPQPSGDIRDIQGWFLYCGMVWNFGRVVRSPFPCNLRGHLC